MLNTPLVHPDILRVLATAGHHSKVLIADGNYPAAEHARRLIRADGIDLVSMLRAVLQVLPIEAAGRASLNNDPAQMGAIHHEIANVCTASGQNFTLTALGGDALYPRIKSAYAIVATSETAFYANVILRKAAFNPTPE